MLAKIIVILGPTSSGKSKLAIKIAKKYDGEIISADSRQVYKKLNIGSGKITKKEMEGIPHYLLDVTSPKRTFTVNQYQKLAKKALKKIIKKGKLPIICGGTGLYIDTLIYDYQLPQVPPQPKLRKQLEKKSTEELFGQLQKLDSRRAQNIDKHNRRRLIRALEI
ncbi:MAG: tRNA (adenosine(37)-N6)-dimethylallyltransferase MiaA, partial [Patescibacteria group bacterium]